AAVTMRTPGNDFELAAGFLFAEGVVRSREDIVRITYCGGPGGDQGLYNTVHVELAAAAPPELATLERHFFATSACGVCGRATLEGLRGRGYARAAPGPLVDAGMLRSLPAKLAAAQGVFQ